MVLTTISLAAIVTALALFASETEAQISRIVPCAIGNGEKELCESCDESKAITVTSWDKATWVKDFTMVEAAAEDGSGYKVFWKVEQPASGCRILLLDKTNTNGGSVVNNLTGRIKLSVSEGGCYVSHIRSANVGVGACCGQACTDIGAYPGRSSNKRDLIPREDMKRLANPHYDSSLFQRGGPVRNPNPWANNKPADAGPAWNCKSSKKGDGYEKLGKQVVDGRAFVCNTPNCDMSASFESSVATTISSEKSTTFTNSQGVNVEVSIGWFTIMGPTANLAVGYNKEWSEAVATSMGASDTKTQSRSISLRWNPDPGFQYNGWWAPVMSCQKYTVTCDKGEGIMEKCEPSLDGSGKQSDQNGVMTTGLG